eukprot:jgi/Orpsp1_1/1180090/evm.model.c7180000072130.1
MLNIKFQVLIILLCYVYSAFSDTSFIPKGQRADIFELTDNEVPVFRVTIPDSEFLALKNIDKKDIILIIWLIPQNLFEAFPNSNISKILPELPMTKDGYSNIDYAKFHVDDYLENNDINNSIAVVNYISNHNSYLNLLKIIYVLSELRMSPNVNKEFKEFILEIKKILVIDENGNYIMSFENFDVDNTESKDNSTVDQLNRSSQFIVEYINSQDFFEAFPNTNFTEILPELPLTENGYPNIDSTKYFITKDDLQKIYEDEDDIFKLYIIFNDDSYLNIIKLIYMLTELDMSSNIDPDFKEFLFDFKNYIMVDENGNFEIDKSYCNKFNNLNNTKELYEIIKKYNNNDPRKTIDNSYKKDFKTKNATMIVEMN